MSQYCFICGKNEPEVSFRTEKHKICEVCIKDAMEKKK